MNEPSTPPGEPPSGPSRSPLAYAESERHPLVEAFLEARCRDRGRPRLDVSAADEMFHYALAEQSHHRGIALFAYLRSGLTAAETLERVLAWRFGSAGRTPSLLDFASGYGRVTRFLAQTIEPSRLTVAEISPSALAFQRRLLAVETVESASRPDELDLDRRFAAVSAMSLFTHLPERSFADWLQRLWAAVEEGGVLAFSVNDEAVLFAGRSLPDSGFYFEPVSENADLGGDEYGTTWVREEWVRAAIAERCVGAVSTARVPRGLWHFQDLYVVRKGGASEAQPLQADDPCVVDLPPEGYLDVCLPIGPDHVRVGGWAIDRARPDRAPRISIEIDGAALAEVEADAERPDLAEALGEAHRRSGFVAEVRSVTAAFPADAVLAVRATSDAGRETLLHLSPLEGADLTRRVAGALDEVRGENLHLRRDNADLHRKIELMEASRFWKLRNAWWRLRG